MFDRFSRRKNWRRFVGISYLALYSAYLIWRCTIVNTDSIVLSIVYLIAETFGLILAFSIILKSWSYNHRAPKPLIYGLSVDVFITTYKEPLHIIKRTVIAAKEIEYPHKTWILDDGKNPELKKFAEEIGVNYLAREQNLNAKAGNLNYGLQHSSGDFVLVFDADHIALPHALNITLGFFADEKISLVQTPQDYYNTTAFQYMNCKKTGAIWTDQSFFYNVSEPCYDSLNNTSCVGTGVIYRRKVLEEIGGIPTATITEDTHTSLKMNKLGYHTVYINEAIAYGIASSDLSEYYKTRRRWGHGNIHAIKEEKILTCKGLTLRQRLMHLSPLFNCLEGWQQLLLLNIPVCTLIFGLAPFQISIFNVLITFFFPFVSYIMLQEIGCGFSRLWTNEIFSIIRWPIHLRVSEAWFGRKLVWSSSMKNIKGKVNYRLMLPQLTVLALSITSLIVAFFTLQQKGFKTGPLFSYLKGKFLGIPQTADIHHVMASGYTADLVLVAGMWVVYNIIRTIYFVYKVIHDSKNSHEFYRFQTPFPLTTSAKNHGYVLEISEEWLKFIDYDLDYGTHKIGEKRAIQIHLPAKILTLQIIIKDISGNIFSAEIIRDETQDDLVRALYSVDWHREFRSRNAYFITPSDFILKILTLKSPNPQKYKEWNSFLYNGKPSVIADFKKENGATIIVFEELKIGQELSGARIGLNFARNVTLKISAEENLSSLVEKGLDGAIVRRYSVTQNYS